MIVFNHKIILALHRAGLYKKLLDVISNADFSEMLDYLLEIMPILHEKPEMTEEEIVNYVHKHGMKNILNNLAENLGKLMGVEINNKPNEKQKN